MSVSSPAFALDAQLENLIDQVSLLTGLLIEEAAILEGEDPDDHTARRLRTLADLFDMSTANARDKRKFALDNFPIHKDKVEQFIPDFVRAGMKDTPELRASILRILQA